MNILMTDPHKAKGAEKVKAQALENVMKESLSANPWGGYNNMNMNRATGYSYEKDIINRVKVKWYYILPAVIVILVIIGLELYNRFF